MSSCIFNNTRKIAALQAAFSISCRELQPSAATVRPNNRALWAHLKILKINLQKFTEIYLDFFAEIHLENFAEIYL